MVRALGVAQRANWGHARGRLALPGQASSAYAGRINSDEGARDVATLARAEEPDATPRLRR